MASLQLISLVLRFLGMLCGPFGAESALGGYQLGDRRSVAGLGPRTWLTAEPFRSHMSQTDGYRNTFAPMVTWIPVDTRWWEFMPPAEHFLANWIKFHEERKDWRRRQRQEAQHGDLTSQRQLSPHESELELGHREGSRLPEHLFKIQGYGEGAHEGAGQLHRSRGNTYHINESGSGKHRAKRSCVLRRVDRFLRRVQRITGRGVLGELIRLAGGLRGDLQFYRILPNGARGVGVSFGAGTPSWRGFRTSVPYLALGNSRGTGVTTAGRREGYLYRGWNGAPSTETTLGAENSGERGVWSGETSDAYLAPDLDGAPRGEANFGAANSGGLGVVSGTGTDGAAASASNGVPIGETNNPDPNEYGSRSSADSNRGSDNEDD